VTDHDRPEPDELYRAILEREARLEALVERLLGRENDRPTSTSRVRHVPSAHGGASVHLTEREEQVLRLLVVGYTNREIGVRLLLETGTIRNYLGRIFRKLAVTTRTQAAVRALELGLVETHADRSATGTTHEGRQDAEGRR
jgi:DNA-binding NarL/FixJ family response regulator